MNYPVQMAVNKVHKYITDEITLLRSFISNVRKKQSSYSKFKSISINVRSKSFILPQTDSPTRWWSTHDILVSYILAKQAFELMFKGTIRSTIGPRSKVICSFVAPFKQTMKWGAANKDHITLSMTLIQFYYLIPRYNTFFTVSTTVEAYRLLKLDPKDAGDFLVDSITEAEYSVVQKVYDDYFSKFETIPRLPAKFLDPSIPNVSLGSDRQRHLKTYQFKCGSNEVIFEKTATTFCACSGRSSRSQPFTCFQSEPSREVRS